MAENPLGLTKREMALVEEIGTLRRLIEVHKLVDICLIARLCGEVKITHAELENSRKNYIMQENIQADNYMADILMRIRLRSAEDDREEMKRRYDE